VGWAALALRGEGNLDVLDDALKSAGQGANLEELDMKRVSKWLGSMRCIVEEGLPRGWDLFQPY